MASARASGVPDVVVVVVVEVDDEELPPHAVSPRAASRIKRNARGPIARKHRCEAGPLEVFPGMTRCETAATGETAMALPGLFTLKETRMLNMNAPKPQT
jgi:hypothetical protein